MQRDASRKVSRLSCLSRDGSTISAANRTSLTERPCKTSPTRRGGPEKRIPCVPRSLDHEQLFARHECPFSSTAPTCFLHCYGAVKPPTRAWRLLFRLLLVSFGSVLWSRPESRLNGTTRERIPETPATAACCLALLSPPAAITSSASSECLRSEKQRCRRKSEQRSQRGCYIGVDHQTVYTMRSVTAAGRRRPRSSQHALGERSGRNPGAG